jgi:hypothetical protein
MLMPELLSLPYDNVSVHTYFKSDYSVKNIDVALGYAFTGSAFSGAFKTFNIFLECIIERVVVAHVAQKIKHKTRWAKALMQ